MTAVDFVPVSPALARVHLLTLALFMIPVLAAIIVGGILLDSLVLWIGLPVWLLAGIWIAVVVVRQVKRLGYAERGDDLLIRRGILFRSTTVVPFGRMQFVDVSSGPVERMFGLATVKLHTASAATDATIPGLPKDEADRLRDILAARGEAQLAGL
ncbi:PH domain-containing protein [Brevibacterium daeguense]|uniref:PH domain-containing protein n=1 Tax=Brevibacterium daeguense TaxID=909936 RepID=A0ABP8EL07_9MICO|nr:PH domain-containing protein [Brevibacterium daeguense]